MHEMTLVAGLLEIIEDQARREGFERVTRVVLEIGAFAGVEREALRFAFLAATSGGLAEGAELVLEEVPGRGRCPGCGTEAALAAFWDPCPGCGTAPMAILAGRELRVVSLDVV
jgi:hydrogenase nickel incorporation protein HypA/HybF